MRAAHVVAMNGISDSDIRSAALSMIDWMECENLLPVSISLRVYSSRNKFPYVLSMVVLLPNDAG